MPKMTGARLLAQTVHGYGIDTVFFVPYIAPRALMEMEALGIKRVQARGEKAAAYMADAYARVRRAPGVPGVGRPGLDRADLEAGHGQPVSQLVDGDRRVDELPQPRHEDSQWGNCSNRRKSLS